MFLLTYHPPISRSSGAGSSRRRVQPSSATGCCAVPAAFSLIELLVVIAIIGILAAFAAPALPSLLGAKGISRAVEDTSGILELARSEAMARRTYVWVAFLNTNAFGSSELRIGAVASLDGTSETSASNLRPIAKALKINNAVLSSALPANVLALVTNPPFAGITGSALPEFTVGGTTFPAATPGLIFSPNGEVLVNPSSLNFLPQVDIGLLSTKGTAIQTGGSDGAIVRYLGGSGNVQVFRP
ncbi:MAG: pilus assembly FimT family protein [Terrimicrobiaceae bacterium]